MNRRLAALALAAGMVLGGASSATADSYIPPQPPVTITPAPTPIPPPPPAVEATETLSPAPVQDSENGRLANTGADWTIFLWALGAIALVGAGAALLSKAEQGKIQGDGWDD